MSTGPEAEWPRTPDGQLAMSNARFDLQALLDAHPAAAS